MVVFKIPHKNTLVLESVSIPALFNTPLIEPTFQLRTYDVEITDLKKNSTYLLDRFSFSCDIEESDYKTALMPQIPSAKIFYGNSSTVATKKDIKLITYYSNTEISTFIKTNSENDTLRIRLSGSLTQISNLVGIYTINFLLSFMIYQIDNNDYNKHFSEELDQNYAFSIRR